MTTWFLAHCNRRWLSTCSRSRWRADHFPMSLRNFSTYSAPALTKRECAGVALATPAINQHPISNLELDLCSHPKSPSEQVIERLVGCGRCISTSRWSRSHYRRVFIQKVRHSNKQGKISRSEAKIVIGRSIKIKRTIDMIVVYGPRS